MMKKRFYTVKDVAALLGRDPESIRRYCRSGQLKARRLAWAYVITDENLKTFLGPDMYSGLIDDDKLPSLTAGPGCDPDKS